MTDEDIRRDLNVLEVGPRATLSEIKNSYLRLRKLYAGGSIVLDPLGEEFSDKRRGRILQDIEEAYARLLVHYKNLASRPRAEEAGPGAGTAGDARGQDTGIGPGREEDFENLTFSGPALRAVREKRGIEIIEISKQLKLRQELLKGLEDERFEILPEEIYLKVHLKNLAACLRLHPTKVVDDYIARYREWKIRNPSRR